MFGKAHYSAIVKEIALKSSDEQRQVRVVFLSENPRPAMLKPSLRKYSVGSNSAQNEKDNLDTPFFCLSSFNVPFGASHPRSNTMDAPYSRSL